MPAAKTDRGTAAADEHHDPGHAGVDELVHALLEAERALGRAACGRARRGRSRRWHGEAGQGCGDREQVLASPTTGGAASAVERRHRQDPLEWCRRQHLEPHQPAAEREAGLPVDGTAGFWWSVDGRAGCRCQRAGARVET